MQINSMEKKKVLFLGNSSLVIFGFRKELVKKLIDDEYEVWVSFPNGPFGDGESISGEFGCKFVETKMNRRGKNPFEEIKLIIDYYKLIKEVKPDVVLAYTAKCDIYGGIICRILNVPFMPNITGLGKGLAEGGIVEFITKSLYKLAVNKAECTFFQNENDKLYFEKNNIKCKESCILPGSGINLNEFKPIEYTSKETIIFTYMARVMRAKGIEEYLEAAKYLKNKYKNVEFHICGYCEEDYIDIINKNKEDGIVIYHGLVKDVKKHYKISSCIVLPSFHPEGISNVLLESAASARPIITTNRPGCRETVDNNVSGFLVREKDYHDLIEKMEKFIRLSYEDKIKMGMNGRRKVEKDFSRDIVVNKYIKKIEEMVI